MAAAVSKKDKERARKLRELIAHHSRLYHTHDAPEISDSAYDALVEELRALEEKHTELVDRHSPTQRVGDAPLEKFTKVPHTTRQWSFDNVFSPEEFNAWDQKVKRFLDRDPVERIPYMCELKIDGLKIVLTYEKGKLIRGATRGDGVVGEDVTHTIRTIRSVPLTLPEPIDTVVIGEAWLSPDELARINKERKKNDEPLFANTRNAAAGSIRQLDSSITASRGLDSFVYDIDAISENKPHTQAEEMKLLGALGFKVNPHGRVCNTPEAVIAYYKEWKDKKDTLPYGVDGIVVKVNDVFLQDSLGYTAKAPRFGVACKFPAEQVTTVVEDVVLQVGRTGILTPVAHLRPVRVAGSVVARATLHNEDEIKRLDVRVGDTVIIQKAGDVIPDIVEVVTSLRTGKEKPFKWPKKVLACGGDGSIERVPGEAAWRCVHKGSLSQKKRLFEHFVSRKAFDVEGVGKQVIAQLLEAGLVNTFDDLFTLEEGDFLSLEGFAEKSAQQAVASIRAARKIQLNKLLVGVSIPHVGEEVARILAESCGTLKTLEGMDKDDLMRIEGVGDIVADSIITWFANTENKIMLQKLLRHISIASVATTPHSSALSGKTFVVTGTLEEFSRDEIKSLVRNHGGAVAESVSSKTDFLLIGKDPGQNKTTAAKRYGVRVIGEHEFQEMLSL